MLGLFSNRKKQSLISNLPFATDIHSHILPALDDGSPDVETSVNLIKGLMEIGISRSIATPHIIGDMYRNNAETITKSLALLKAELEKQNIDFTLSAAAEYMLDSYFFELLAEKKPLLTVDKNIVLTEFSYSSKPEQVEKMSFSIITEGYIPILAHPERYAYFHRNMETYSHLKDLGFLLQVNVLSIVGYYGKDVAKAAAFILKNDLATYIATDLHHERHLQMLKEPSTLNLLSRMLGHKTWNQF